MVKQYLFFVLIFRLTFNLSIITLPFDNYYFIHNQLNSPNEKFNELLNNFVRVNISIGDPKQEISLNLTFNSYITYLSGSDVKGGFKKFNEKISKSYNKIENKISQFYLEHFVKGIKSTENFYLLFNGKDEKVINNFNFILANELNNLEEMGQLGLCYGNIYSGNKLENYNFISQLHKKKLIDSYSFTIKYNDLNKGELIIGALPHEYNRRYNKNDFISIKAGNTQEISWSILFKELRYGNEIFMKNLFIEFQLELGLIIASSELKEKLINDFFNHNPNCHMLKDEERISFYCDNDKGINKFKDLILTSEVGNFNFVLNYKDLFEKHGEKFYFLIVFPLTDNINTWKLGKPFLRKFQIVFDQDKKIIGFYTKMSSNNFPIIITFLICLFVIIGLSLFIYIYVNKKRRKKRNNEIDDGFDYYTTEELNKKPILGI